MAASVGVVPPDPALEDLEIDLLLEGVYRRYGQDFRGYRRQSLRHRLHRTMRMTGVETVSALQERVLHDAAACEQLLRALSARPAAMFDDHRYFRVLREKALPFLRSSPSPRIWIAECVAAEDAYALAILAAEEGLADRVQIFATAASDLLLQEARAGIFESGRGNEYAENHRRSGGAGAFSDYFRVQGGQAVFSAALRTNLTWALHSLATDASFNEFQLIVCRRVLHDFGAALRMRALQLFADSMPLLGMLGADCDEGLKAGPFATRFKPVEEGAGLYRRVG